MVSLPSESKWLLTVRCTPVDHVVHFGPVNRGWDVIAPNVTTLRYEGCIELFSTTRIGCLYSLAPYNSETKTCHIQGLFWTLPLMNPPDAFKNWWKYQIKSKIFCSAYWVNWLAGWLIILLLLSSEVFFSKVYRMRVNNKKQKLKSNVFQDALRGRRCASLRSATTPARGADDSGRSTPSAAPRASPSPADAPAPKKSNWEVIEHFSSSRVKKSPTAVSITAINIAIVIWTFFYVCAFWLAELRMELFGTISFFCEWVESDFF